VLQSQEQRTLERADVVFAASEELAGRRRPMNSNTHVVENGVNYALFAQAQSSSTTTPDDVARIEGPLVGCVTTQTSMMDIDLLRSIFSRSPHWSLAFIGVDRQGALEADSRVAPMLEMRNVHFIGRRPHADIPAYLKRCDVCVIPWTVNDITVVSSSPLKLYEYLAAGKPVVCKPLPLMKHLASVVHFADDVGEWLCGIETALTRTRAQDISARQAIARAITWDKRAAFISEKLAEGLRDRP
jgi:glycosyltransferase involved in cell wall biosynthesis